MALEICLDFLESECAVCGKPLFGPKCAVPMWEGEMVGHDAVEWTGFDACEDCHEIWERRFSNSKAGHDALWGWFCLSYASWLTLPRVLMHEMPDEWQGKMAELLLEIEAEFPGAVELPANKVMAVDERGRFARWPREVLNYRHPDREFIARMRRR